MEVITNYMEMYGSDCAMSSPVEMRVLISTAALCGRLLQKLHLKSPSLQTGSASLDVYVIPTRKYTDSCRVLWRLHTAAYGLVNANSKWEAINDDQLLAIGFEATPLMPQRFMTKIEGHMIAL